MKTDSKIICKDIDNNQYSTIIVGNKAWMCENLKVTRYNDGTLIPVLNDHDDWRDDIKGAMCYYDNDKSEGALYNFHAVNTKKLAPEGWRVPTYEEWDELEKVVEGWDVKLGGIRDYDGSRLGSLGCYGYWWASTPSGMGFAWSRYLNSTEVGESFNRSSNGSSGFSVRCLRDLTEAEKNL